MEEIEKITTEITEDICDIETDFYCRKLAVGSSTGKLYIYENNFLIRKLSDILYLSKIILKLSSSNVFFVAKKIAEIKNLDIEKVIEITAENAKSLFDI